VIIDCDVPCGFDPRAIKAVFAAAFRAASDDEWEGSHVLPKRITSIGTRKLGNPAWCSKLKRIPYVGMHLYVNPRRTMRQHARDWYVALGGRKSIIFERNFDSFEDVVFPPRPPKAKRERREPVQAERLTKARASVEEWEAKRKTAQRALKLAKTKLRSLRATVRGLEREVKKAPPERAVGYDAQAFSAHMRTRREMAT
jgi:hypothetical protein